jgi:hypothetical protein
MYMRKRRRVGQNSICRKWLSVIVVIGFIARAPASVQKFGYHLALSTDVSVGERLKAGHQPWVANHVAHELFGITANAEET